MNTRQKVVAMLGGLALAYVVLSPPGYEVYQPGDIGYDQFGGLNQTSSITQDWIYTHDEISFGYLILEVAVIAVLWWGGHWLFKTD